MHITIIQLILTSYSKPPRNKHTHIHTCCSIVPPNVTLLGVGFFHSLMNREAEIGNVGA